MISSVDKVKMLGKRGHVQMDNTTFELDLRYKHDRNMVSVIRKKSKKSVNEPTSMFLTRKLGLSSSIPTNLQNSKAAKRPMYAFNKSPEILQSLTSTLQRMSLLGKSNKVLPMNYNKDLNLHMMTPYKPHAYQIETVKWMRTRKLGGLISLSMGLGKTMVCLSHLATQPGPRLVIVPSPLITSWLRDCRKFFGDALHMKPSTSKELKFAQPPHSLIDPVARACEDSSWQQCDQLTINLLTYDQISRAPEHSYVFQVTWGVICADESHVFANQKTNLFMKLMNLEGHHKFCLTGTPICNETQDVQNQLKFIRSRERGVASADLPPEEVMDFIYARTYSDVGISLPPKNTWIQKIKLNAMERRIYDTIQSAPMLQIARIQILRQVCVMPCLVSHLGQVTTHLDEESKLWLRQEIESVADLGKLSSKLTALLDILKDVCIEGKRQIIIYCTFARGLQWAQRIIPHGITSGLLCARVDLESRQKILDRFMTKKIQVLLLTYKLGSSGLNLQNCCDVVFMNPWWSHISTRQAETRVYRMGQQETVRVYSLVAENSVEEEVLSVSDLKDDQMCALLNSAVANSIAINDKTHSEFDSLV